MSLLMFGCHLLIPCDRFMRMLITMLKNSLNRKELPILKLKLMRLMLSVHFRVLAQECFKTDLEI